MKSESSLTLHKQQRNYQVQSPEGFKDIIKIVHITSVVQPYFYEAMRIHFVQQEIK